MDQEAKDDNESNRQSAGVPQLRNVRFSDLPAQMQRTRSRPLPPRTPVRVDNDFDRPAANPPTLPAAAKAEPQQMHARVAQALGVRVDEINDAGETPPPLPDPLTTESMCEWLKEVTANMESRSSYRKALVGAVQRYEFEKRKAEA
jgi:hypothetical protein